MWKLTRSLIYPRWHAKQKCVESNITILNQKAAVVSTNFENKRNYDENYRGTDESSKQSKKYWNCNQFQYILSKSFFLETAGWLGTVTVLCFNFHFKHFNSFYKHGKGHSQCLFSKNVLAMPQTSAEESFSPDANDFVTPAILTPSTSNNARTTKVKISSIADKMEDLKTGTIQYSAAVLNSDGLSMLNNNSKKAFRSFQSAARLGSSQGFYNLGLCYELGKGTRVNLNRAAFCYRKAAMMGHGLASYNLAIYFFKGMGGLPVDHQTARLLLSEAAEKEVPEAQLYVGLENLEEGKFPEAYEIFKCLDKKVLDGKYYLGLCYENGWGIDKNEKAAVEIFSEAATQGHTKSILKLSRCYEDGLSGCSRDLDFASSLCQIVSDKGDEEGRIALNRIKCKQNSIISSEVLPSKKISSHKSESSFLSNSTSVPEIAHRVHAIKDNIGALTLAYLDLFTSFLPNKHKTSSKPTFFIGEESYDAAVYQKGHEDLLQATHTPVCAVANT